MDFTSSLFSLAFYFIVLCLCIYVLTSNLRSRKSRFLLPPGPYQYPIIGNLHQIGKMPHQSFAKLSKIYGPLMSVRLGSKLTMVVSSPEIAREVLQKNDHICSGRSLPNAAYSLDHHKFSLLWLPPSTRWRNLRKICREQMFSTQRLDASQALRQEKLKELRDYVHSCSNTRKAIDIGEAAFTTSLNLISRTLFSVDFGNYDSDSSQELKDIVWGVMKNIGSPNVSDYFPVLQPIDPQGIMRDTKSCIQSLFNIFGGIINQRLIARESASSETMKIDLLDALLDENGKNEAEFSFNALKHLLLDLFIAGTDTTSGTVEWAMAELLRNPEKLQKGREELNLATGLEKGVVQESDISRLPYLQSIVKETFRLHPPGPLLAPHQASEDVEINGYTVTKDTQILVNAYAIGRDEIWEEPEMFKPERFLESEIDIKGKHFELIPFGAGRRICPGLPLAYRMVHLMLASLIHNIDWKLEGVIEPQELNMDEKFGLTVQKAIPLKAIPALWQVY
ncbi:OLC1v1038991C1 [Oldenlandia corymbosa var. corymbosa]|uniref:OLC1v1038991C1 n=1 Tax=Oldenlandia corymbosa var. corymbosa TaxID=529605 RepID=A0AAV1D448_OLDCO|nr:OLC1v1038991C1 [Oldenlandia corymbosa var. corymbosa]